MPFLALIFTQTITWSIEASARPALEAPATKVTESSEEAKLLAEVTSAYRKAALVEISVEKQISYEWKPKVDISKGKMFYSHGKIRWEIEVPEKNWTIYDGKTWWNIEFASEDFPGSKNKVIATKVEKENKAQFLLLDLLDSKNPSELFLIKNKLDHKANEAEVTMTLQPKKKSGFSNIEVVIVKEAKIFKEVSFKDDIGNGIKIILATPIFQKNGKEKLFKYKPDPSKDQVSHL